MNLKLNRKKALEAFAAYVNNYDAKAEKIRLKIEHTYRVAGLCQQIAKSADFNENDVNIAWFTGLLHDVGRFEQLRRYGTFIDAESIDHAEFGADLLFGEGLIRNFIEDDSYDDLLEKAVRYHSAYRLPKDLTDYERKFANLLRDADKIDILKVNVDFPLEEIYNVSTDELKNCMVTKEVMDAFYEEHAVLRSLKKTPVDNVVGHISLMYELTYPVSYKLVKEQGFLDRLMDFESKMPETNLQFELIRKKMKEYIDKKADNNYSEKDLVRIAKRENNTKRNYLVVNPLQGKHIPVSPLKALGLFRELAGTMKGVYDDERLLFVGFAETATAIGAQVAIAMNGRYIQTTREVIPDAEYLFFTESHSHATEQKLVKDDILSVIGETDRIIFVEDEVTTGNTIINIIDILEKLNSGRLKFSVASLLNGMSEEHLKRYNDRNIGLHYLVKTNHSPYAEIADGFKEDGNYYKYGTNMSQKLQEQELCILGKMDARRLVNAPDYEKACEALWNKVSENVGLISESSILVVGTEEFMYPALYIGKKLEELGNNVSCHSTTRSPIAVSMDNGYPLHDRYELKSLYDNKRKTFIYDIGEYDRVFVVTDAPLSETEGLNTLINSLGAKNKNITLIRWC